jgi:muramoyltetrapeptide carboxypeptidase
VLTALLATRFEPDFRGALLFLEDVQEPAYRLDRMLPQWIQTGKWSKAAGILVGKIAPAKGDTADDLRRVFFDAGKRLSVPVWFGFPAGHDGRNVALPFGVRARVDAKGRLKLLEPPVGEG